MCHAYFSSSKEFAAGVWKGRFGDFGCNWLRSHLSWVRNMEIAHFSVFCGKKNHEFLTPPYCFNIEFFNILKQVFSKVPNVVPSYSKTCSSATSPLIWKWFSPWIYFKKYKTWKWLPGTLRLISWWKVTFDHLLRFTLSFQSFGKQRKLWHWSA